MSSFIYLVTARFHWGFSIRTPYGSAAQLSYRVPPITTIVGALAQAYALTHRDSIGEVPMGKLMYEFWKNYKIKYVSTSIVPTIPFQTLIRYFRGYYQTAEMYYDLVMKREPIASLYGPVGFGYISSVNGLCNIVLISEGEIEPQIFNSVTRLGSKESVLTTIDSIALEDECLEEIKSNNFVYDVKFSFPREIAREVSGNYAIELHPWPITAKEWQDYCLRQAKFPKVTHKEIIAPILFALPDRGVRVEVVEDVYVVATSNITKRQKTGQEIIYGNVLIPKGML